MSFLILLLSLFSMVFSVEVELSGRVLNQNNLPIAFVEVEVPGLGVKDTTDSEGYWGIVGDYEVDEPTKEIQSTPFQLGNGTVSGWNAKAEVLELKVFSLLGSPVTQLEKQIPAGPWSLDLRAELEKYSQGMYIVRMQMGEQLNVFKINGLRVLKGSYFHKQRLNNEEMIDKILYKLQGELITEDELPQYKQYIEKYLVERNIEGSVLADSLDRGFEVFRAQARFWGGKTNREVVARLGFSKLNSRYTGKIYSVKSLDGINYEFFVQVELLDLHLHKIAQSEIYPFDTFFGNLELPEFMNGNCLPQLVAEIPTIKLTPNDTLRIDPISFIDIKGGEVKTWELRTDSLGEFVLQDSLNLKVVLPDSAVEEVKFWVKMIDNDSNAVIEELVYTNMVQGEIEATLQVLPEKITIRDSFYAEITFFDTTAAFQGTLTKWEYQPKGSEIWELGDLSLMDSSVIRLPLVANDSVENWPIRVRLTDDDGNVLTIDSIYTGIELDEPMALSEFPEGIRKPFPHYVKTEEVYLPAVTRSIDSLIDSIYWKYEGFDPSTGALIPESYGEGYLYSDSVGLTLSKDFVDSFRVSMKVVYEANRSKEFATTVYIQGAETAFALKSPTSILLGDTTEIEIGDADGILASTVIWGDGDTLVSTDATVLRHVYQSSRALEYEIQVIVEDSVGEKKSKVFTVQVDPYLNLAGQLLYEGTGKEFRVEIAGTEFSTTTVGGSYTFKDSTLMPLNSLTLLVKNIFVDAQDSVLLESLEILSPQNQNRQDSLRSIPVSGKVTAVLGKVALTDVKQLNLYYRRVGQENFYKQSLEYDNVDGSFEGMAYDGMIPDTDSYEFKLEGIDASGGVTLASPLNTKLAKGAKFGFSDLAANNAHPVLNPVLSSETVASASNFFVTLNFSDLPIDSMTSLTVLFNGDTYSPSVDSVNEIIELVSPELEGSYPITMTATDLDGYSVTEEVTINVTNISLDWELVNDQFAENTYQIGQYAAISVTNVADYDSIKVQWEAAAGFSKSLSYKYSSVGTKNFVIHAWQKGSALPQVINATLQVVPYVQGSITIAGVEGLADSYLGEVRLEWVDQSLGLKNDTILAYSSYSAEFSINDNSLDSSAFSGGAEFQIYLNGNLMYLGGSETSIWRVQSDTTFAMRKVQLATGATDKTLFTAGTFNQITSVDSVVLFHKLSSTVTQEIPLTNWAPTTNKLPEFIYLNNPLTTTDTIWLEGYNKTTQRLLSFTDRIGGTIANTVKTFTQVPSDRAMPQFTVTGSVSVYGAKSSNYGFQTCTDFGEAGAVNCSISFDSSKTFVESMSLAHAWYEAGAELVIFKGEDAIGNVSLDTLEVTVLDGTGSFTISPTTVATQTPGDTIVFTLSSVADQNGIKEFVFSDDLSTRKDTTTSLTHAYVLPSAALIPPGTSTSIEISVHFVDNINSVTKKIIAVQVTNDVPQISAEGVDLEASSTGNVYKIPLVTTDLGEIVNYEFISNLTGSLSSTSNEILIPDAAILNYSNDSVTLRVTDDDGNVDEQKVRLRVGFFITDERDGQKYRYDKGIMLDPLNYGDFAKGEKRCLNDIEVNCTRKGAYYTWQQAIQLGSGKNNEGNVFQGICPEGWKLPKEMVDGWGSTLKTSETIESATYFYDGSSWNASVYHQLWDANPAITNADMGSYSSSTNWNSVGTGYPTEAGQWALQVVCVRGGDEVNTFKLSSADTLINSPITLDWSEYQAYRAYKQHNSIPFEAISSVSVDVMYWDKGFSLKQTLSASSGASSLSFTPTQSGLYQFITTYTISPGITVQDISFLPVFDSFKDSRDGKTYRVMELAGTVHMVDNLDYRPTSGYTKVYDPDASDLTNFKEGLLYHQNTAFQMNTGTTNIPSGSLTGVCPQGFALPTVDDYTYFDIMYSNIKSYVSNNGFAAFSHREWQFAAFPKTGTNYVPSGMNVVSGGINNLDQTEFTMWLSPNSAAGSNLQRFDHGNSWRRDNVNFLSTSIEYYLAVRCVISPTDFNSIY